MSGCLWSNDAILYYFLSPIAVGNAYAYQKSEAPLAADLLVHMTFVDLAVIYLHVERTCVACLMGDYRQLGVK